MEFEEICPWSIYLWNSEWLSALSEYEHHAFIHSKFHSLMFQSIIIIVRFFELYSAVSQYGFGLASLIYMCVVPLRNEKRYKIKTRRRFIFGSFHFAKGGCFWLESEMDKFRNKIQIFKF